MDNPLNGTLLEKAFDTLCNLLVNILHSIGSVFIDADYVFETIIGACIVLVIVSVLLIINNIISFYKENVEAEEVPHQRSF